MLWNIAFPGSVMVLKLLFKMLIEQKLKPVDVAKAILAFPIDIAFLSFSFGAAFLYSRPITALTQDDPQKMASIIVGTIVLLAITTLFSRKSDDSFNVSKFGKAFLYVVFAYVLSAGAFWGALHIKALAI
jgi:hypothetical protein